MTPFNGLMTLDRFYLIDRIELVVAQAPAGQTSHQIWVGEASGALTKVREYIDALTVDDQTLSMPVDPPLAVDRVLILTTKSPSWVAWREVRVFGVPAPQPQAAIASKITVEKLLEWPRINLRGIWRCRYRSPTRATEAAGCSWSSKGAVSGLSATGNCLPLPSSTYQSMFLLRGERGLLGVVFPPGYAEKRYFYVNYTNTEGDT